MLWTDLALLIALILANTVGVAMLIPQAIKLARTGATHGVSPAWIGVGMAINIGWLAYGLDQDLWGLLPVSVASAAVYGFMALRLNHIAPPEGLRARRVATSLLAAFATVMVVSGSTGLGLVLGAAYTLQFSPAAIAAKRANDVSGIAVSTWTLALFEALLWAAYGFAVTDVAVLFGGVGAAAMSSLIIVSVLQKQEPRDFFGRVSPWKRDRASHLVDAHPGPHGSSRSVSSSRR